MKNLTAEDLISFQKAVFDDYGVKLEDDDLHKAAFDLLHFFEALINFDMEDNNNKNRQKVLKLS